MASSTIKKITPESIGSIRIYTSVTALGLTSGSATLSGVLAAMPNGTMFFGDNGNFASSELPFAGWQGVIRIIKKNSSLAAAYADGFDSYYYGDYRMFQSGQNAFTGTWVRTVFVANGTFTQNPNYTTNANTSMNVKRYGNIVSVYGYILPTYEVPAWATIGTIAPAPPVPQQALIFPDSAAPGYDVAPALLYVDGHLDTFYKSLKPNHKWYIQLTYFI